MLRVCNHYRILLYVINYWLLFPGILLHPNSWIHSAMKGSEGVLTCEWTHAYNGNLMQLKKKAPSLYFWFTVKAVLQHHSVERYRTVPSSSKHMRKTIYSLDIILSSSCQMCTQSITATTEQNREFITGRGAAVVHFMKDTKLHAALQTSDPDTRFIFQ